MIATPQGKKPPFPFPLLKLWRLIHREVKDMANFESCKKVQNAPESVPYIVHESSMARMERQIKRLWIAVIVAIVLLFASNAAWIYAWCQYDYSSEEIVTVDGKDGIANYIGDDGDIVNGESYGSEAEETNP